MRMTLELELPRDNVTVPLARHLARSALKAVGVHEECVSDVEVAITEACTNVIDHSGPGDAYNVQLRLEDHVCSIRIIDLGAGFDTDGAGDVEAGPGDESGRGIALMRALMDMVQFESGTEAGTLVHLQKTLVYKDGAPATKLADPDQAAPDGTTDGEPATG